MTAIACERVLADIYAGRDSAVAELLEFLRFPSISADPAHRRDMISCARWLADCFVLRGMTASVETTPGHPIVLARNHHEPDRVTVLLYGHYDVQPVDPVDQWTTPPFKPAIRKTAAGTDAVFARGAADDKGQIAAHLEAIRAWQSADGLPINLVVVIEGEEEIDSHHLAEFISKHRDGLGADVAIISDTSCFARGVPAITTGLRGLVYSQITMQAARSDLHSGIHGGAVLNPAHALARLIADLHDKNGKVALPHFYDDVRSVSEMEKSAWEALAVDEAEYAATLGLLGGIKTLAGEVGFSTLERRWARPTCDVCGIASGYQGEGAKTIIPASASAKISFRLVRDQDPRKIQTGLEEFVRSHSPAGLATTVKHFAAAPAALAPIDGAWIGAAKTAYEIGYGTQPVMVRDGLTIPVVNILSRELGIETLLIGFGLPDDQPHAPNEKFDIDALHCGARTAAALYAELSAAKIL